ncbi:MAG TPA: TIM barrel protein [Nocardioides sp.]|uniref:TIM barrel protein n=1 Tax=Nocardioides sp. TaxID=35761 RepID=UPI002E345014|nr:TIM barrel protein [Nocardioides sp.]HEX5090638.1 TIM barrel protein [Nocardioides sp.]
MTSSLPLDRIAGAPISWGLCEVPGWGYQLTPGRVLSEMQELGLAATEFGPPGFLDPDADSRVAQLASYGLHAVGGFHVAVLHDPDHDPLPGVDAFIDECLAAKAGMVVVAAGTGQDGYDARPELDEAGWQTLLGNLDRIADHARSRGVEASLHPHLGTVIESGAETRRVVDGSRIGLCLDTGHLAAAGADPVEIVHADPQRVRHVHLKDVRSALAAEVVSGETSFAEAVRRGMFVPLGTGDVDIAGIVTTLEDAGYQGWYVLEQDVMLPGEPEGEGPVADVRKSLEFLTGGAA